MTNVRITIKERERSDNSNSLGQRAALVELIGMVMGDVLLRWLAGWLAWWLVGAAAPARVMVRWLMVMVVWWLGWWHIILGNGE